MLRLSPASKLGIYDLFEIFKYLPISTLLNISILSRDYRDILEQPSFWRAQYKQLGMPVPIDDEEATRASFIDAYQSKANQLGKEISFLRSRKARLLKHFEQSINFNKIVRSLNFIISKEAQLKSYNLNLGELDTVLNRFNQMLATEQMPLDGWPHVRFNFLTRDIDQLLSGILSRNPQNDMVANRITHMDLSNCMLEKLPKPIEQFYQLESLNLYDTMLNELPDNLSLRHLRQLCISGGSFNSIPACLLRLSSLRALCLPDNKIQQLPTELFALGRLKVLFLNNNLIVHIPPCFADLQLDEIALFGNRLDLESCAAAKAYWPKISLDNLAMQQTPPNGDGPEFVSAVEVTADEVTPLLYQFEQMNLAQEREDNELALDLARHGVGFG